MGASTTTASTIVSINGVIQIPTLAYSVSGTTLTFTEAPTSSDVIDVRRLTTTQSLSGLQSGNNNMSVSVDNSGVYVSTGRGTSSAVTTLWNNDGAVVNQIANVSVASANTATTVDTMDNTLYRTAKYVVQVSNAGNYQAMEALLIQNGTTATITTYGVVQTNGNLGVLTATVSGSNTLVQFTSLSSSSVVRVQKDYLIL